MLSAPEKRFLIEEGKPAEKQQKKFINFIIFMFTRYAQKLYNSGEKWR